MIDRLPCFNINFRSLGERGTSRFIHCRARSRQWEGHRSRRFLEGAIDGRKAFRQTQPTFFRRLKLMIRPNVTMQIPSKTITGQPIRSLRAPLPSLLLSVAFGAILAGWTSEAEHAKPTQSKDGPPA